MERHKGYLPNMEHGIIVWYKTTRTKAISVNLKTGVEQRIGSAMESIQTNTSDYEEACKQLDRRLSSPKADPQVKADPNQLKLL